MSRQTEIAAALGVRPGSSPEEEYERRAAFLADYAAAAGVRGYVLGISGGIDSSVAGKLAQEVCRRSGRTFTAMRLPYGTQIDETDAKAAIDWIAPDEVLTVDIKDATDGMTAEIARTMPKDQLDFVKGNIKARERMIAQYAVASARQALVVGTDHAAEAVMGFFTKYGDGACDVAPLTGLLKRQVRAIGTLLGAPQRLVDKVPTADLEDNRPQLPDEEAYGVTYAQIDAYLSGEELDPDAVRTIEKAYAATGHKRALPATP
jgi:NAD+ synthase